ncbi:MAG: LamG domain-containing protein [Armatimonadota bacterium]
MSECCQFGTLVILASLLLVTSAAPRCAAAQLVGHWEATAIEGNTLPDLTGSDSDGDLTRAKVLNKIEDLVEHPCVYLDGTQGHVTIPNRQALNPKALTISAWLTVRPGGADTQKPIMVKSLPTHASPWYQYGLFVMNEGEPELQLSCYLSIGGKLQLVQAPSVVDYDSWGLATATWDGKAARLYWNGEQVAVQEGPAGDVDGYDTPLVLGAYGNLAKQAEYCLGGAISSLRVYDHALGAEEVRQLYDSEKAAYPAAAKQTAVESPYAKRLNEALRQGHDVWGEDLIARGGATYDNIKDLLHPLFYSTGDDYRQQGVHNLLFAENGGQPPYLVPLADGSRIAAPVYNSPHRLEFLMGEGGREAFGSNLDRLKGGVLEAGYYPILQTSYTDETGLKVAQESFAGRVPGISGLVALVRLQIDPTAATASTPVFKVRLADGQRGALKASGSSIWEEAETAYQYRCPRDSGMQTIYLLWSPEGDLPPEATVDAGVYNAARQGWQAYWDKALSSAAKFEVPEPVVMNAQRNLLIQNLMMRWRYSVGAVVYHGSFYQPEGSDAVSLLGLYGYPEACGEGLADLLPMAKGDGYYTNWEWGEKLTHGAQYYLLTRDADFINRNTAQYRQMCQALAEQMAKDPHGLLEKQRHCGDIPEAGYCTFHLMVCWRGMRDMAQVWKLTGHSAESQETEATAARLKSAIQKALDKSVAWLPDGSLFVPNTLLDQHTPFEPITATRLGSYWNLCMPYAFASGFWEPGSKEMNGISRYLHQHGGLLLGLLRFNYYPVRIGSFRPGGLPGYSTTGFDNVYLPAYERMLSDRGEADRLVLTFYGKLAHGQTRNTFVNGEGETVGEVPGERYRSCYGTPSSANNTAFLLPLRLMLVRESFDHQNGMPEGLYLADAAPREWLAPGKTIRVKEAPTYFGTLSYTLKRETSGRRLLAEIDLPARDPIKVLRLKLRLPGKQRVRAVTVNGKPWERFDPEQETIDLTGLQGKLRVAAAIN